MTTLFFLRYPFLICFLLAAVWLAYAAYTRGGKNKWL